MSCNIEGCPYDCDEQHRVFDPSKRTFVPCPYCMSKLKLGEVAELSNEDVLTKEYGIDLEDYKEDRVIPVQSLPYLDEDSLEDFRITVSNLLQLLRQPGISLDRSYMLGVTEKGNSVRLASALLKNWLLSGVSVAPLFTASEYNRAVDRDDYDFITPIWESVGAIALVDNGTSRSAIQAIKGLLENRALHDKATVVVTTWSMIATARLLSWDGAKEKDQCEPHFVIYKSDKSSEQNWYVRGIVGLTNSNNDVD